MTDLSEVRLVRTDGDSWDITESVGATALGAAAARAAETARPADAADWLAEHGWRVDAVPSAEEMTRLGRPATEDLVEEAMDSVFVHARFEGGAR